MKDLPGLIKRKKYRCRDAVPRGNRDGKRILFSGKHRGSIPDNGGIEMSVVMFGGNKCMERRYLDTCKKYGYKAKVFNKMTGTSMKKQVGSPDMIILFTNSVSHKMAHCAHCEAKRCKACVYRCHDSLNALENLLQDIRKEDGQAAAAGRKKGRR